FPPKPLSRAAVHHIISRHCKTVRPSSFIEAGCAVCGYLVPLKQLTLLEKYEGSL
ncbi:hypothetical protein B0H16DRAFT_1241476, partial [Mycena metata]